MRFDHKTGTLTLDTTEGVKKKEYPYTWNWGERQKLYFDPLIEKGTGMAMNAYYELPDTGDLLFETSDGQLLFFRQDGKIYHGIVPYLSRSEARADGEENATVLNARQEVEQALKGLPNSAWEMMKAMGSSAPGTAVTRWDDIINFSADGIAYAYLNSRVTAEEISQVVGRLAADIGSLIPALDGDESGQPGVQLVVDKLEMIETKYAASRSEARVDRGRRLFLIAGGVGALGFGLDRILPAQEAAPVFVDQRVKHIPGKETIETIQEAMALVGNEYAKPDVGFHAGTGAPRDHVVIRNGKIVKVGDYGAPSKDGVALPSLIQMLLAPKAFLNKVTRPREEILRAILTELQSLAAFQEKEGTEVYGGLFPWHKYEGGARQIVDYGGRYMVPTLDNSQTTVGGLLALVGALWDAKRGTLEGDVRDLAYKILKKQDYTKFVDRNGNLVQEYVFGSEGKPGHFLYKEGHDLLSTEWAIGHLFAFLTKAITEDSWKRLDHESFVWESPAGPLDMLKFYLWSGHEAWILQYFAPQIAKSKLYPLYLNFAYLHDLHARVNGMPGYAATEYRKPGIYVPAGPNPEGLPVGERPENLRPRLATPYGTALASLIHPPSVEWLPVLFRQKGVMTPFGYVTGYDMDAEDGEGASGVMTADNTFSTFNSMGELGAFIQGQPGVVNAGILRALKGLYDISEADVIRAFDLHAEAILKEISQNQGRLAVLRKHGLEKRRDEFLVVDPGQILGPPKGKDYSLKPAAARKLPGDALDLMELMPEEGWFTGRADTPTVRGNEFKTTYDIKAGGDQYAYAGVAVRKPFPISIKTDGKITQYNTASLWVPVDYQGYFEIEFKGGGQEISRRIYVNGSDEGVLSKDKKWKRLVYAFYPTDEASGEALDVSEIAVSLPDPRFNPNPAKGTIHFRGLRLHTGDPRDIKKETPEGPGEAAPAERKPEKGKPEKDKTQSKAESPAPSVALSYKELKEKYEEAARSGDPRKMKEFIQANLADRVQNEGDLSGFAPHYTIFKKGVSDSELGSGKHYASSPRPFSDMLRELAEKAWIVLKDIPRSELRVAPSDAALRVFRAAFVNETIQVSDSAGSPAAAALKLNPLMTAETLAGGLNQLFTTLGYGAHGSGTPKLLARAESRTIVEISVFRAENREESQIPNQKAHVDYGGDLASALNYFFTHVSPRSEVRQADNTQFARETEGPSATKPRKGRSRAEVRVSSEFELPQGRNEIAPRDSIIFTSNKPFVLQVNYPDSRQNDFAEGEYVGKSADSYLFQYRDGILYGRLLLAGSGLEQHPEQLLPSPETLASPGQQDLTEAWTSIGNEPFEIVIIRNEWIQVTNNGQDALQIWPLQDRRSESRLSAGSADSETGRDGRRIATAASQVRADQRGPRLGEQAKSEARSSKLQRLVKSLDRTEVEAVQRILDSLKDNEGYIRLDAVQKMGGQPIAYRRKPGKKAFSVGGDSALTVVQTRENLRKGDVVLAVLTQAHHMDSQGEFDWLDLRNIPRFHIGRVAQGFITGGAGADTYWADVEESGGDILDAEAVRLAGYPDPAKLSDIVSPISHTLFRLAKTTIVTPRRRHRRTAEKKSPPGSVASATQPSIQRPPTTYEHKRPSSDGGTVTEYGGLETWTDSDGHLSSGHVRGTRYEPPPVFYDPETGGFERSELRVSSEKTEPRFETVSFEGREIWVLSGKHGAGLLQKFQEEFVPHVEPDDSKEWIFLSESGDNPLVAEPEVIAIQAFAQERNILLVNPLIDIHNPAVIDRVAAEHPEIDKNELYALWGMMQLGSVQNQNRFRTPQEGIAIVAKTYHKMWPQVPEDDMKASILQLFLQAVQNNMTWHGKIQRYRDWLTEALNAISHQALRYLLRQHTGKKVFLYIGGGHRPILENQDISPQNKLSDDQIAQILNKQKQAHQRLRSEVRYAADEGAGILIDDPGRFDVHMRVHRGFLIATFYWGDQKFVTTYIEKLAARNGLEKGKTPFLDIKGDAMEELRAKAPALIQTLLRAQPAPEVAGNEVAFLGPQAAFPREGLAYAALFNRLAPAERHIVILKGSQATINAQMSALEEINRIYEKEGYPRVESTTAFHETVQRLFRSGVDPDRMGGYALNQSEALALMRQIPEGQVRIISQLHWDSEASAAALALAQLIQAAVHQAIERAA